KSYLFNGELARSLHYAIERTRLHYVRSGKEARRRISERHTPDMFSTGNRQTALAIREVPGVSQRKDIAALQASEISYRRLFETAKDGILILDSGTGRIKDVNPFLINLLGFSREEIIGQTVGELSPFKDTVANEAMLEQLQQ